MSKIELMPCPFCGGAATLNHGATDDWDVSCRNTRCFGPQTSMYGLREDAIAAWNRRFTSSEPSLVSLTDPLRSGDATRKDAEAMAPIREMSLTEKAHRDQEWIDAANKAADVGAAKLLEELAPIPDVPVVAWRYWKPGVPNGYWDFAGAPMVPSSEPLVRRADHLAAVEKLTWDRDEAIRNAGKVCDSYADENQRLFDRASSAEATIEKLREVLRPFSDIAGEMFARNWNKSDVVIEFRASKPYDRAMTLLTSSFFDARAALSEKDHDNG